MTKPDRIEGEGRRGWSLDQPDTGEDTAAKAADKAFEGEGGPPGSRREISEEERSGVSSTDTEARSALGVGVSKRRSAQDLADKEDEEGRASQGVKGKTERRHGTSSAEDSTGVDPQESVTGGPNLPKGDQSS
jgi:hypothetical protein